MKGVFNTALSAYFKELDGMTLADIVTPVSAQAVGGGMLCRRLASQ